MLRIDYIFHERHGKRGNFVLFVNLVEENDKNSLFSQNDNQPHLRRGVLLCSNRTSILPRNVSHGKMKHSKAFARK